MVWGMAAAMTPKAVGTTTPSTATSPFDRVRVLERLFALPLPPHRKGRRPYPVDTPLGRVMRVKDLMIREVAAMPDCPNERLISDYLAGRREIADHHRAALARGLGVDPRIL